MEKYKRYYGVGIFVVIVVLVIMLLQYLIVPKTTELSQLKEKLSNKEEEVANLQKKLSIVQNKIKKIKNSIVTSQKKIYYPIESDLGNDSLFFTLYNDVIEMVHSNSVKIKSIESIYNPESDAFVKFGKDVYFVCDLDMELVANYINIGKLVQSIYQYPYYIKIISIDIKPYEKNKKILLTNLILRLYAHTSPENTD